MRHADRLIEATRALSKAASDHAKAATLARLYPSPINLTRVKEARESLRSAQDAAGKAITALKAADSRNGKRPDLKIVRASGIPSNVSLSP